jgi:hypothetical protein
MGGRNVMMGNFEYTPLERSWATIDIAQGERSWDHVLRQTLPADEKLTQGQIDKLAMSYGLKFMISHPGLTLKRSCVKFFNYWQLERSLIAGAVDGRFGSFSKLTLALLAVLICGANAAGMFAGAFGAVMLPPQDLRLHWFLLSLVFFPCAVHTLIFAHSRYLLPQMPIVLLYAAVALVSWRSLWQRRHEWSFRLAALACVVLACGWMREIVFVDLGRYMHLAG